MTANHALEFYPGESQADRKFILQDEPSARKALKEHIKIVGVGGGGNNALNHIIRTGITDVEFLGVNTDVRCLDNCLAPDKLVLGEKLTKGLGAGMRPEVGMQAAVESREEIRARLRGCDMVYLAAGMGGGTGTGAMPVIAQIAKDLGILTVAVVTRPFAFEGKKRKRFADEGIEKLSDIVDALLVVPNDRLLDLSERTTTLAEAFAMADGILRQAVKGVTDLITRAGVVNVDFADLRSVMTHAGPAVMGVGSASGEDRLNTALKRAMESPLMESPMEGAKGVLFNITSSQEMGLMEVEAAAELLRGRIDPDAHYIWGWVQDENIGDAVQVVVIATGFGPAETQSAPVLSAPRGAGERPKPRGQFMEKFDPSDTQIGFIADDGSEYDTPAYMRRKQGQ